MRRTNQVQERFLELRELAMEWHGEGHALDGRIIGRTKEGKAVALICEDPPGRPPHNRLTRLRLDEILAEAGERGLEIPAQVWAAGSDAPEDGEKYQLHRIIVWPEDREEESP